MRPLSVLRRELLTPPGLAESRPRRSATRVELRRLIRRAARGARALQHLGRAGRRGGRARARVPHVWHVREIYVAVRARVAAYRGCS